MSNGCIKYLNKWGSKDYLYCNMLCDRCIIERQHSRQHVINLCGKTCLKSPSLWRRSSTSGGLSSCHSLVLGFRSAIRHCRSAALCSLSSVAHCSSLPGAFARSPLETAHWAVSRALRTPLHPTLWVRGFLPRLLLTGSSGGIAAWMRVSSKSG